MEALNITSQQRELLLEMIVALFTNLKDVKYGKDYDRDEIWMRDENNNPIEIHWLDFCINHLSHKLCENYTPMQRAEFLTSFGQRILFLHAHPVDILLEEYINNYKK